MTETMDDPQLLTTDADFRIYRRHGRQIVPIVFPGPAAALRTRPRYVRVSRP
jgi:hypothetical protein